MSTSKICDSNSVDHTVMKRTPITRLVVPCESKGGAFSGASAKVVRRLSCNSPHGTAAGADPSCRVPDNASDDPNYFFLLEVKAGRHDAVF
jgi:hypothetical protein